MAKYFQLISLWLMIFLSGCVVGPNFQKPAPLKIKSYTQKPISQTAQAPIQAGKSQHFEKGRDIPNQWWALFQSPKLNHLIHKGLQNNPTIDAAKAALCQAKENWRAQFGDTVFPSVDGSFTASRQRFSDESFGINSAPPVTFNLFNAAVDVSYNLDFFGGSIRGLESLCALVDYQKFLLEGTYLTLTANIVIAAINEAQLNEQIKATHEIINSQTKQVNILRKQFELGATSKNEVLTQEAQLAQVKSALPVLEKSLALTQHSLAILIGEFPSQSKDANFHLNDLTLPTELPISIPSLLVRQRPDIRASEALLHQASAQVGVATAALFPKFTISGNYGWESNILAQLFKPQNVVWNLTGNVLQPLFHGGALLARRRAAIAAYNQAHANYRNTVLLGFQNVADALRSLEFDAISLKTQVDAEKTAKALLDLNEMQFKLGAVNYLSMLNANRAYQDAIVLRIKAQGQRYMDTVSLFQALGGGWWNDDV